VTSGRAAACTLFATLAAACAAAPVPEGASPEGTPARYLYVWAGDQDEQDPDFLAVMDIDPDSPTYGDIIATVPTDMGGGMPHHLEYELPPSGALLFANAHHHEHILLFDVRQAAQPRLVRTLSPPAPYRYPHDFTRLPNGNVLVGFLRSEGASPASGDDTSPGGHGGLAEYDAQGGLVRTASAAVAELDMPVRPYGLAVLPGIDRLLTTSAAMMESYSANVVQLWRLSDLTLLHTLDVPAARLPDGTTLELGHDLPFVPRALPDGSVLFHAYGCGVYRVSDIGTAAPRIDNVHTVDTRRVAADSLAACGVPVLLGRYWIIPAGRLNVLIVLDVSDPARPVEAFRLATDDAFRPHWLAHDPGSSRIIVGAEDGGEDRMLMALFDRNTGRLSWDESLRGEDGVLGISLRRGRWPHGETGAAFAHAALFRP
jgi:hypothetical protein